MVYTASGPNGEGEAWRGAPEQPATAPSTRPAPLPDKNLSETDLARQLQLAFAPIHKFAFGTAVGTAIALLVAAVTVIHLTVLPETADPLQLLDEYFYGYSVSFVGIFIGAFWGFVVGFFGGWFAAFCRNLGIAVSVFVTRTRAELSETREFLDHI